MSPPSDTLATRAAFILSWLAVGEGGAAAGPDAARAGPVPGRQGPLVSPPTPPQQRRGARAGHAGYGREGHVDLSSCKWHCRDERWCTGTTHGHGKRVSIRMVIIQSVGLKACSATGITVRPAVLPLHSRLLHRRRGHASADAAHSRSSSGRQPGQQRWRREHATQDRGCQWCRGLACTVWSVHAGRRRTAEGERDGRRQRCCGLFGAVRSVYASRRGAAEGQRDGRRAAERQRDRRRWRWKWGRRRGHQAAGPALHSRRVQTCQRCWAGGGSGAAWVGRGGDVGWYDNGNFSCG